MAAIIPLNCPAFRSEFREKKPAEGAASVSRRQVAALAIIAISAWILLLAPLLILA